MAGQARGRRRPLTPSQKTASWTSVASGAAAAAPPPLLPRLASLASSGGRLDGVFAAAAPATLPPASRRCAIQESPDADMPRSMPPLLGSPWPAPLLAGRGLSAQPSPPLLLPVGGAQPLGLAIVPPRSGRIVAGGQLAALGAAKSPASRAPSSSGASSSAWGSGATLFNRGRRQKKPKPLPLSGATVCCVGLAEAPCWPPPAASQLRPAVSGGGPEATWPTAPDAMEPLPAGSQPLPLPGGPSPHASVPRTPAAGQPLSGDAIPGKVPVGVGGAMVRPLPTLKMHCAAAADAGTSAPLPPSAPSWG